MKSFKIITTLFALLFIGKVSSQSIKEGVDYKYLGAPYYPEQKLTALDSLKWPITFEISIEVKDIKGLEVSSDEFIANLLVTSFSNYEKQYLATVGDTINLQPDNWFSLYKNESNLTGSYFSEISYFNKSEYDYLFSDSIKLKTIQLIEAPFDINWNLRNYPFDDQELKFKFTTMADTSIVKLKSSEFLKSSFNNSMENLKDGFTIKEIRAKSSYNIDNSDYINTAPSVYRPLVTQTLEIILDVNREGSSLFLKLFVGGILSYFISCLIFLIPVQQLESRITLGVGAIFGAIGNRYFIDSILPSVQVFTKSDALNNLIILMVTVNMIIMILQSSNKNKYVFSKWIDEHYFFYSIYNFLVLFLGVLLW